MSLQTFDSFGDDNFSDWTTNVDFQQDTGTTYDGDGSAHYSTGEENNFVLMRRDITDKITRLKLYYRETSNSQGGFYSLRDSNNNRIAIWGTSNPVYTYSDDGTAKSANTHPTNNYDTWVRTELTFDYQNYDIDFVFDDGISQHTETGSFGVNAQPEELLFINASNKEQLNEYRSNNAGYNHWTDQIEVEYYDLKPTTPTNVTVSATGSNRELFVDWDYISEAKGYYVERSTNNTSWSQVADVGSTGYTDTGLRDGERYYYRIIAYK
jgi:hypothetical protein